MTRGTQLSAALTILFAVALLAFAGPAVATDGTGDATLDSESDVGDAQTGTIDIAVEPAELEMPPGDITTYEVVVYGATNGIEGYDNIEITIEDPSVAQFVDYFETANNNQGSSGPFSNTEIRDQNGNGVDKGPVFWMEAGLGDKTFGGADRTVIAELDIEALGDVGNAANVSIAEQPGGDPPIIQNPDEDTQLADTLFPSSVSVTNLTVDVLGTNRPVVGDDLEVEFEVQNIGNATETQQLTLTTTPGIGSASTSVTLDSGNATVETLTVPTQSGDAGEYTVTVASNNSMDSTNATVFATPGFAVEVLDTNEPVEGSDIQVEFEVENLDNVEDTQSVTVTTPNIGSVSTDVTLGGGDTTVETLNLTTQVGESGDYTVTVASNDNNDTAPVTVLAEPEFLLNITNVDEGLVEGDLLSVNYTVNNTGDVLDTQDIEFSVDGTLQKTEQNVTVTAGATVPRSFVYETQTGDAPSIDVAVTSEDDTDTETVPVDEPPFFDTTITNVDANVTEGESITVDYQVENTGGVEGTQTISFTVDGNEEDSEFGVTLNNGETFTGTFTYTTASGDAPNVTVGVTSEDDTATATAPVDEPPFFAMTITSIDSEVTEGESITVGYQIENTGDVTGTQDIEFTVDGASEGTETGLTLGSSGTFTGTFSYDTVAGDAPSVFVSVSSANDSDTDAVTVNEPAFFAVTITGIDQEVVEGDTVTVDYQVENTGDVQTTQDITLAVDGTTEDTTSVPLGGGQTFTGTSSYDTVTGDAPSVDVSLSSENDSATDTVTVDEPPFFDVTITSANTEVVEGETITVGYEVTNTGDVQDTQDIVLTVNGTTEDTEGGLNLGGGNTFSGQLTYQTETGDAPEVSVTVESANDTATDTVTVFEPAFFDVSITSVANEVTEGETITVNYEATNTGDVQGTQDIELAVDGTTKDTEAGLSLGGGNASSGQLTYTTVTGDAPSVDISVSSDDDTANDTVIVNEPSFFNVTITGVNDPVNESESVTVKYAVENTGDIADTQNISFEVNGTVEGTEPDVVLAGGETFNGTFSYTTETGDAPSIDVAVASNDDTASASATVDELASFAVVITSVEQNVPEGAEVDVEYGVENTGDVEGTQDIEFSVDGTPIDTEPNVTLDSGESFTGTFVYTTESGDAPEITVTVASENDTATETASVSQEAIFAVSITDIDDPVISGETVSVDYEVTNTGDVQATQDISFEVDGTPADTEGVTLGGGNSFTGTFTYNTSGSDVPEIAVAVASEDSTADRTVTVNEPAFFNVTITGINETVIEGETVAVDYEVTNTGDVQATQDIVFEVDGGFEGIENDLTLGGGQTFTGTFSYDTVAGDAPSVDVSLSSGSDIANDTVTVLEPAAAALSGLDIAGQDDAAVIAVGTNADVTVTVTNTGDEADTFDVTLEIGSTVTTVETTGELGGGESETVTFTGVTNVLDVGEYSVTASTSDDSSSGSLDVNEPAQSTLTGLSIAAGGTEALIAGGDDENVSVSLTNVGGLADEFNVTLGIVTPDGSQPVEETVSVSVDSGATTLATFGNVTGEIPSELPPYAVTVSTANDSVEGELTVWPDVNNDGNPATNTTGDVKLNNVDGDGSFDIFDVQALFKHFVDDPVQNTPAAFNFNEDEDTEVTILDVQSLFNLLEKVDP